MKILIIDRDTLSTQLIRSKLEGLGHQIVEEPVKTNALEKLEEDDFDVVFFDPAPLNNARPIVLGIRRGAGNYPYIVLISQDMDHAEAIKAGANNIIEKPVDSNALEPMLENAVKLTDLITRIGSDTEDFPSAGGVIAKSAFNQILLSGIERADRYAERSFIVVIDIENYDEIINIDGPQSAAYSVAKLSQYLVRLRRQSDIIGQTGKAEFSLMLQRPQYETEPLEAANRFAENIGKLTDITESETARIDVRVQLIELPMGTLHVEHVVHLDKRGAQRA